MKRAVLLVLVACLVSVGCASEERRRFARQREPRRPEARARRRRRVLSSSPCRVRTTSTARSSTRHRPLPAATTTRCGRTAGTTPWRSPTSSRCTRSSTAPCGSPTPSPSMPRSKRIWRRKPRRRPTCWCRCTPTTRHRSWSPRGRRQLRLATYDAAIVAKFIDVYAVDGPTVPEKGATCRGAIGIPPDRPTAT